eukprot:scaffold592097_cov24-Prasinocladus_malaysianus.AAC.1
MATSAMAVLWHDAVQLNAWRSEYVVSISLGYQMCNTEQNPSCVLSVSRWISLQLYMYAAAESTAEDGIKKRPKYE